MALLCLMGRAVREAGELNLLLQLMFVATCSPAVKHALLAWLITEERYAGLEFEEEPGVVEDGWGGPDGYYRGFMTPKGRVVLWRHVTRFGLAVMIPVVTAPPVRLPGKLVTTRCPSLTWLLSPLSFLQIFGPGLEPLTNCVLIVPVS
jgi:hypothetical protein